MALRRSAGFALSFGLIVTGAAAQAPPPAASMPDVAFTPEQMSFHTTPIKGSEAAVLLGGVDKPGLYTFRSHLFKGALIPPHTHPDARMITVLSGELFAGKGEQFDPKSGTLYGPGSFFLVPAGSPHFTWAPNGDVMYQEQGFGPTPTAFIPQKAAP